MPFKIVILLENPRLYKDKKTWLW